MSSQEHEFETVSLQLKTGARKLQIKSKIPVTSITMLDVVPSLHKLCDSIVSAASEVVQRQGKQISCKAGCGSCCSQLVPVSVVEMQYISDYLDTLPEDRFSELKHRFEKAMEYLKERGLTERLDAYIEDHSVESKTKLGEAYFRINVSCPFLENGSCSIYEVRPSMCRQFLVTSDAKHCALLDKDNIKSINIRPSIAKLLMHYPDGEQQQLPTWQPLVYLMQWRAKKNNGTFSQHTGPKLLQRLYNALESYNN